MVVMQMVRVSVMDCWCSLLDGSGDRQGDLVPYWHLRRVEVLHPNRSEDPGHLPQHGTRLKEDVSPISVDRHINLNLMRLELSWTRLGIRLTPVYAGGFQQATPRFITLIRFNRSALGRGFPDVAAQAQGLTFQVVIGGELYAIGGTSASAPVRLTHRPPHLSFLLILVPPIKLSLPWSLS